MNGCGIFSSSPPTVPLEKRSLNSVMQEGIETFKNGNFDKAIEIFQYVKDTYPFSPEALVAQLKLADAFYYKHDYENALLSYQQFIKLHPKHKQAPYALYQAGMCYFHQIPSIDRDQTPTKNALEMFKRLIKEHPKSRYTKRALIKIKICREK
ncbi:MAG: outer membrane protein assembly factor BamD, partial [Candidatus Desulfofervidus sp.]|nr:outer membrane protein assembly factor BamD [Candidatus Desulfofervidus sp.]